MIPDEANIKMEGGGLLYYPQRGSTASRQCPRTPISLLTIWHCSRLGYLIWLASQSIQSLSYQARATRLPYLFVKKLAYPTYAVSSKGWHIMLLGDGFGSSPDL